MKPAQYYFYSDVQFTALIENILEIEREAGIVYVVKQEDCQVLTVSRVTDNIGYLMQEIRIHRSTNK